MHDARDRDRPRTFRCGGEKPTMKLSFDSEDRGVFKQQL